MNVISTIANMYTVNYEHSLMSLLYCPCLCCHSFLWLCVVVSSGNECMNLCRLWWFFTLTDFITTHLCASPMPWCRFLCYMSWYFYGQLLDAIGGCFVVVAIGGIVDHNYLNLLFIIAIIALMFPISNSNMACYVRFVNRTIL